MRIPAKIAFLMRSKTAALAMSSFSAAMLMVAPSFVLTSVTGVLCSFLILHCPAAYIPLILVSSMSSSYSVFGIVAALFFYGFMMLLSLLLRSDFRIKGLVRRQYIYIAVFAAWALVCSVISGSGTAYAVVRLAVLLALLFMLLVTPGLRYDDCLDAVLFSAPILTLACLLKYFLAPQIYEIEGAYFTSYRLTIVEGLNPNQLAPLIAFFTIALFISGLEKKNWMMLGCALLSFILLSVIKSRTAFYATSAICGLAFITTGSIRPYVRAGVSALAVLAAVFILFPVGGKNTSETDSVDTKTMDLSTIIEDGASGRVFTWAEAFTDIIPSHPVFGIGFGKPAYEHIGYDFDADDMYIDLLSEFGIPGFLLYMLMFISLLRLAAGRKGGKLVSMTMALLLLYGIGETLFDTELSWVLLFFVFLFLNFSENELTEDLC